MNTFYSDKELVEGVIEKNNVIVYHFFFEKCTPMFHYINRQVFDGQAEINELIDELYLFLQEDDWRRLRTFDCRCQLTSWLTRIAIRFFRKHIDELIVHEADEELTDEQEAEDIDEVIGQKLDAEFLINSLKNKTYQAVLRKLVMEDMNPQQLADEMEITVENLYNIKSRAIQKLAQIV